MALLALLLVFPLTWPFVAKVWWKHEITFGEMAANLAIVALVVVVGWHGGRWLEAADTEILNGQLTSKERDRVSCSHSYRCRCRQVCTGSGKNRSCSETCDTCYDHSFDYDWVLHTSVGRLVVDRVDRQGLSEPARFTRAGIGDPVAVTRSYQNYIKAAPDSLFNAMSEKTVLARYGQNVPPYPAQVRDLHYVDRVLAEGLPLADLPQWNQDLAKGLRTLGALKQVNVVLLLTNRADAAYADAVRVKWLGGKKNDVIVLIGAPEYPRIGWVRVLSWTKNELFKVQLRDDLLALDALDRTAVLSTIDKHIAAGFVRRPMADFEYLASEIQPPLWLVVVLGLGGAVLSVILSLVFAGNGTRPAGLRRPPVSIASLRAHWRPAGPRRTWR